MKIFKRNKKRLIFSIYSSELEDYPYFPFFAKDIDGGIRLFTRFLLDRGRICGKPELHIIGECEFDNHLGYIKPQPYFHVYKVDLQSKKSNLIITSEELFRKMENSFSRVIFQFKDCLRNNVFRQLRFFNEGSEKDV